MKNVLQKVLFEKGNTIVSIKADGTVLADSFNPAVEYWDENTSKNLCDSYYKTKKQFFFPVDAAAGTYTFFLISENGDVIQKGQNDDIEKYGYIDTKNWKNIKEIVADFHAVGLKTDGTVVASGYNSYGQCNVNNWNDIISVNCSLFHTVGIKKDRTVVACGDNSDGKCNVADWKDVKKIICDSDYTIGICNNGSVLYAGSKNAFSDDIVKWEDIKDIVTCSDYLVVGLKKDGTLIFSGSQYEDQNYGELNNLVSVALAGYLVVGLDNKGKIHVTGNNPVNDFSSYNAREYETWEDVLTLISFNNGFIALQKNGELKTCLPNKTAFRSLPLPKVRKWSGFTSFDCLEQDYITGFNKMKEEARIRFNCCRHCGGKFSGFFKKKCSVCGIEKDY